MHSTYTLVVALAAITLVACGGPVQTDNIPSQPDISPPTAATETVHVVDVSTEGMDFILPREIPSGWVRFTYQNRSPWTHFILIDRLPMHNGAQITFEQFSQNVPQHFIKALELIQQDQKEQAFEALGGLPEWFFAVEFKGGVGLLSPGQVGQSTVYLQPGEYLIECYVKTNGVFHPMQVPLTVTQSSSETVPPAADLTVMLSAERGLELSAPPVAGRQTFEVQFADQKAYEHFLGHDVHLMKIDSDAALESLSYWLDWSHIEGLETPAPGTFLGGMQDMSAGNKGYFTVDLAPGRYALVAEVPDPAGKGLVKTFTVGASGAE